MLTKRDLLFHNMNSELNRPLIWTVRNALCKQSILLSDWLKAGRSLDTTCQCTKDALQQWIGRWRLSGQIVQSQCAVGKDPGDMTRTHNMTLVRLTHGERRRIGQCLLELVRQRDNVAVHQKCMLQISSTTHTIRCFQSQIPFPSILDHCGERWRHIR